MVSRRTEEEAVLQTLFDLVRAHPGRLTAPLLGYPAARLTSSTVRENLFDGALHARSVIEWARRYRPDVVFLMMDLSVEAGAIGLPLRFPENESPSVERHPVRSVDDLARFERQDPLADSRLQGFLQALRVVRNEVDGVRGAYAIGPFTLAGLLIGASEIALATIRSPDLVRAAVSFSERIVGAYARELVRAGADLVAFLEPTAVLLSPTAFETFCASPISRLVRSLEAMTVLHVCGNTTRLLPVMARTGAQGLSLDAPVSFPDAARVVPPETVLIGNVDPVRVMLHGTPEDVRVAVRRLKEGMASFPNFVLSTGCDCPFETPFENLQAFLDEGRG